MGTSELSQAELNLVSDAEHLITTLRVLADAHHQAKKYAYRLLNTKTSRAEAAQRKMIQNLSNGTAAKEMNELAAWLEKRYQISEQDSNQIQPRQEKNSIEFEVHSVPEPQVNDVGGDIRDRQDQELTTNGPGTASGGISPEQSVITGGEEGCESDDVVQSGGEPKPVVENGPERNFVEEGEDVQPNQSDAVAIDMFIKEIVALDELESIKDRAEAQVCIEACEKARLESEQFFDSLRSVSVTVAERLDQHPSLPDDIESEVRALIESRHQSLMLISKMLKRLESRIPLVEVPEQWELPSLGCSEESLAAMVIQQATLVQVQNRIKEHVRLHSLERYSCVSTPRDLARSVSKQLIDFIARHLLPILDSLDDGRTYTQPLLDPSNGKNAAAFAETIRDAYGQARLDLLTVIAAVGVDVIPVVIGSPIDYECQEPFDSEPHPSMPEETVLSVSRNGYQKRVSDKITRNIRMAQVVIVRNPKGNG